MGLRAWFFCAGLSVSAACSGESSTTSRERPLDAGTPSARDGSADRDGALEDGGFDGSTSDASQSCSPSTCAEVGWACGQIVNGCGDVIDCADEGKVCEQGEMCIGGLNGPTACVAGNPGWTCEVCSAIPDCSAAPSPTRLTGRVVTPGRDDADTPNQLGVPNAYVYVLRSADPNVLTASQADIPVDEMSCDRCEEQDLGPVLTGAVTDATGAFTIEGNLPVGREVVLVTKAGKFRRAVKYTLPASAACQTTTLPSSAAENPARLPRHMTDGLAVNIPRIAVSTGRIDAMECVFAKMGIAASEFGNPGTDGTATPRIHLYRGGLSSSAPSGARIDDDTPYDAVLYGDLTRLQRYDMVVADCEGQRWDGEASSNFAQRDASGANVREYVNRGGRLFASHLSFSWLHENGSAAYSAAAPFATGLGPAATWATDTDITVSGTGQIALGRTNASPHVQGFADWMVNEGVTTAPDYTFVLREPRSQATALGPQSEEFVVGVDGNTRVQQFSFNTPYGAPAEAACGRVAYSGFHVSGGGSSSAFESAIFPEHCTGDAANQGLLTDQEKVLLYMLFDLGACVGDEPPPPPPPCEPETCESLSASCGFTPDGCGQVLDCGPCTPG